RWTFGRHSKAKKASPSPPAYHGPSCSLAAVLFVGGDDALHQGMSDDVSLGDLNHADPFDAPQGMLRLDQSGFLVRRQIDLSDVAGNDRFGTEAKAGQKHKH